MMPAAPRRARRIVVVGAIVGAMAVALDVMLPTNALPTNLTMPATKSTPACQPTGTTCFRGGGANTLVRFKPSDPESHSPDGCCSACLNNTACLAWQLIGKNLLLLGGEGTECWLMNTTSTKNMTGCVTGLRPFKPVNHSHYPGIWVQNGDEDPRLGGLDILYGKDLPATWSDLEVQDGVWDWTSIDSAWQDAIKAGWYIETALMVGPASPSWIYQSGVPPVNITPKSGHDNQPQIFPSYLSPRYQELFLRAIDRFADHIASLPSWMRSKIVAVQAMYGSTGDDCPWHGVPEHPAQDISDEQWWNYTVSLAPAVCHSYRTQGLHVLWNANDTKLNYYISICPESFIKAGMVSHSFQTNYEADNYLGKGAVCHHEGYHCRGESWPFCQAGFFQEAPLWNTYWHAMWQLTFGVDMPGLSAVNIVNESYRSTYELFNKYATSVRPPSSSWRGGIVLLRDGLDSNDTDRFPESIYGKAVSGNSERMVNIARSLSHRGAAEGDPKSASSDAMRSRQPNSMNDVGWRIWRGNYGNGLLNQIAPENTSIGWWRQGPLDQPYGRFARSFDSASGKNEMGFALDSNLFGGLPLAQPFPGGLTIQLVYLDGSGQFALKLDTHKGCEAVAQFNCTQTGRWISAKVPVPSSAYFGGRCKLSNIEDGGADVTLVGDGSSNIMFHSVEVYTNNAGS